MKILLHIGLEKTGTKSLQKFLSQNRTRMMAGGFLYSHAPGNENHVKLAAYAQVYGAPSPVAQIVGIRSEAGLKEMRTELRKAIKDEIRKTDCGVVIYSNEHCSSRLRTVEELRALQDLFEELVEEIRIIVYLRRQDEMLLSSYSTAVKAGQTQRIENDSPAMVAEWYDYRRLLELWISVFGRPNVVCRVYDRARLYKGTITEDFAQILGIDIKNYRPVCAQNVSLDVSTLEFLRIMNYVVPQYVEERVNPDRGNLTALLEKISNGPLPTLEKPFLAEVMRLARPSNEWVADAFFAGQKCDVGDPLFGNNLDDRNLEVIRELSVNEAVEIAGKLWRMQQETIRNMRSAGRAASSRDTLLRSSSD